jgi:hypothetical protein
MIELKKRKNLKIEFDAVPLDFEVIKYKPLKKQ